MGRGQGVRAEMILGQDVFQAIKPCNQLARSAADKCAQKILDSTTLFMIAAVMLSECSGLKTTISFRLNFTLLWSSLTLLKSV